MRLRLGSSLSALVVAFHAATGHGREAIYSEPVNLHAARAAQAADVAHQAATVAKRVAAHTEEVAQHTAAALHYTQDALQRAGANKDDVDMVGKEAESLEAEAGIASGEAQKRSYRENSRHSNVGEDSSKHFGDDGLVSDAGVDEEGLDVNSEIAPYPSGVEPFGQEEPAKELTKESVKQSDGMVDQIENAQGTEAKRSVYRALTKLRGATIASYDGMAKGHLSNVDNYNQKHKWREDHPMKHLAEEEADTHIWAFPNRARDTGKPLFHSGPAPAPPVPAA